MENEMQIRAYYAFIYDWFSKKGIDMLDSLTGTLKGLSKRKIIKEQGINVMEYSSELSNTKSEIVNIPMTENASIKEIEDVCLEIIKGKLIWASNFSDEKGISMVNYAKYIIELIE